METGPEVGVDWGVPLGDGDGELVPLGVEPGVDGCVGEGVTLSVGVGVGVEVWSGVGVELAPGVGVVLALGVPVGDGVCD